MKLAVLHKCLCPHGGSLPLVPLQSSVPGAIGLVKGVCLSCTVTLRRTIPGHCRLAFAVYNSSSVPLNLQFSTLLVASTQTPVGTVSVVLQSGMNNVVWCSDSFCQVLFVPVLQNCQGVLYSVSEKVIVPYDCSAIVPGFKIDEE